MNKWQQNSYGNNSVSPWDSGSSLNTQANVLSSLVGGAPDAVQQLLAASKLLTNVLAPQQGLLQTPQVPSLLGQGGYGNRGQAGSYDRFRNVGGRDNWGQNRRNDSGNYRNNNRGNQQNQRNKSSSSSLASQKKDGKNKKTEDSADKEELASGEKDGSKETINRFADIPKALLYCHVCHKYMWDDVSFDNHVKGRNHKVMLEELDKLYKMQCEIMRQEFRMSEQQHGWYYDKAQRMGKKLKKPLEYCTMCDLNYHGTRGFHRKSTKHQELKHFLHPNCAVCNLEFPTRLEWDEHILLPAHLKKMAARRKELKPELKDDDFDFDDFLYVSDLSDYLSSDLKAANSILNDITPTIAEKDEKDVEEEKEEKDDGDDEEKKEKKEKVDETSIVFHADEENAVETFLEEIRNLTEEEYSKKTFVRYQPTVPAGVEFMVQSAGHLCRICNLFVGSREDALKHCKGYAHHISLVTLLAKVNQARKTIRKRTYKDGKEEDAEMKESGDGGEEGNWKRRKTEDGKDKKMDVDDEEDEDEDGSGAHVNGNAADDTEEKNGSGGAADTKKGGDEIKEETDEETAKPEPPATPRTTAAQRSRRGRQRK